MGKFLETHKLSKPIQEKYAFLWQEIESVNK